MGIFDDQYVTVECCNCGVQFGMTKLYNKSRRDDHRSFFCPNGHSLSFRGESDAEKLKRERDRLAQQIAHKDDTIKKMEREAIAARGQMTKLRKRVGNGTCPCCNRTFENLHRHMKTKHPEFKSAEIVPLKTA